MDLVLDGAQLEDFADALGEAFPSWDALKQLIRYRLGLQLQRIAAESGLDKTISALLDAAEAQGWLVLLLRQARRANPGNAGLLKLEQELLPLFSTEQLQQLEKLIENEPLESRQLEKLAELSAPPGWILPPALGVENRPATTFARLVDSLSSAQAQTTGPHPLLRFIQQLAREVGEPTARQLQAWLPEVAKSTALPAPVEKPRPHTLRLFVKCESKKSDAGLPEDEVFVTAWLWSMDEDQKPLSPIPEPIFPRTPTTLGKLPELLVQMLNEQKVAHALWLTRNRMTIEVCLRHKLLSQDVDAWPLPLGEEEDKVRLGFQYPLVVRPFERLYEARWRGWGLWRSKWEQLKQHQGTPGESPVEWILPRDMGEKLAERLGHARILCVAIPARCETKLLQRSVDAGAPAVLTLRREDVTQQKAKQYIKKLLEGRLIELPDRVHKARQQTGKSPALEEHITLLWDDPDRLPPDAENESVLTAPTVG